VRARVQELKVPARLNQQAGHDITSAR
jgi:hypothetical protein